MTPTKKQISDVMRAMGKKGGPARAASLSPARRAEIALSAAKARWLNHKAKP